MYTYNTYTETLSTRKNDFNFSYSAVQNTCENINIFKQNHKTSKS